MPVMDLPTVVRILCTAAGEDETLDLDVGADDATLADLGFDSLVLLDAVTRIEREYGVTLPEDRLSGVVTVGGLLDLVHECVPASRPA